MRRKLVLWVSGIVIAIGTGLAVVVLITALWPLREPRTNAFPSSDEGVALTIDGHPVSIIQFLAERAQTEKARVDTESILSRVVPDDDPSGTTDIWGGDSPLFETAVESMGYGRWNLLFERHKIDAMVLSALIVEYAHYASGVEAGFTMSDEEVQAIVEQRKANYEFSGVRIADKTSRTSSFYIDTEAETHIQSLGAEYYWTTYYPEQERRAGIATKWLSSFITNDTPSEDASRRLVEITKEAILSADVEITGEIKVGATVGEAIAFYLDWEQVFSASQ